MPQFRIATTNGTELVNGKKFSHYVDNVRYWFFYSEDLIVSELYSGFKMCTVSYSARSAALGNDKLACKNALDDLIIKYGSKNVKQIIDNAPKLKEVKP